MEVVRYCSYSVRRVWWCALDGAVQCRGRRVVVVAPGGHGPVAIHRHWGGRRASHSAHALRHSSQSGAGSRALGLRGRSGLPGERIPLISAPKVLMKSCRFLELENRTTAASRA